MALECIKKTYSVQVAQDTIINMEDYLSTTYQLEEVLTNVLKRILKDPNIAKGMSREIIWDEVCYECIFLSSSTFFKYQVIEKMAYQLYNLSIGLENGRPHFMEANLDYLCAYNIINNPRITRTILIMGLLIRNYYDLCQKSAYQLFLVIPNKPVSYHWFAIKHLIRIIKHKNEINFSNNTIEKVITEYFDDIKIVKQLLQNYTLLTNLDKLNYYYSSDILIH
jgi:hypothetical protein